MSDSDDDIGLGGNDDDEALLPRFLRPRRPNPGRCRRTVVHTPDKSHCCSASQMVQDEPEAEDEDEDDSASDGEEDDGVNFAGKPKKRLKKSSMFVEVEAEASTDEVAPTTLAKLCSPLPLPRQK